jgi:hypothetical protein
VLLDAVVANRPWNVRSNSGRFIPHTSRSVAHPPQMATILMSFPVATSLECGRPEWHRGRAPGSSSAGHHSRTADKGGCATAGGHMVRAYPQRVHLPSHARSTGYTSDPCSRGHGSRLGAALRFLAAAVLLGRLGSFALGLSHASQPRRRSS